MAINQINRQEKIEWINGLCDDHKIILYDTIHVMLSNIKGDALLISTKRKYETRISSMTEKLSIIKNEYEEKISNLKKSFNEREYELIKNVGRAEERYENIKNKEILNNEIKLCIKNEMDNVCNLLTPQKIGKFSERWTLDYLSKEFKNYDIELRDVSSVKGGGDIYLEYKNIRFLIESKSLTSDSFYKNYPSIMKCFKNDLTNAVCENKVDCGIFVAQRAECIPHKGEINIERLYTEKGEILAFYVAGIFENPYRLSFVIRMAVEFLGKNPVKNTELSTVLMKMKELSDSFLSLKESITDRKKIISSMEIAISGLKKYVLHDEIKINSILDSFINMKSKVGIHSEENILQDTYKKLMIKYGKVSKNSMIDAIKNYGLGMRDLYKHGGLKKLKSHYDSTN